MKSYTVHQPPAPPPERIDRAESLVFVKDGFSIIAFVVAPIWLLANRMWLVLFGYVVAFAALELVLSAFGASEAGRRAVMLGLNLLVGFEADSLRRWTLERKGWTLIGTVTGDNEAVCERRFLENWLPTVPTLEVATGGGPRMADPFHEATRTPEASNLGVAVEAKAKRGLFGGWRSQ